MIKHILTSILFAVCSMSANAFDALPKTVQVILPYGAGGVADMQFRHLQHYFSERGTNLVGVYKPGANGIIAMQELTRSAKDGTVISLTAAGIVANAELQLKTTVADPLTITGITMHAIVTHPDSRYNTLASFEKALRSQDPDLNIGYHAVGNLLVMDQYFSRIGAMPGPTRVPYKTSVDSSTAVIGKHLQTAMIPLAVAMPLSKDGKLKILAVAGPRTVVPPKGVTSLSTRWSDWRHLDAFMLAAPTGWSAQTTEAWLSALETYFKDLHTKEFYNKEYLGSEVFGPPAARVMIVNARRDVERTLVQPR